MTLPVDQRARTTLRDFFSPRRTLAIQQARELLAEAGDGQPPHQHEHWLAALTLGWDALHHERYDEAREAAETVRRVGVRTDIAELRAESTRLLAWHAHNFGYTGQALRWWSEALRDAHLAGDPELITQLSIDTCHAFTRVGELEAAEQLCRSLAAPATRREWWEFGISNERAHASLALGFLEKARRYLDVALPLAEPYQDGIAGLHVALASAKLSRLEGEPQSLDYLNVQIALSQRLQVPEYEGKFVAEKGWRLLDVERDVDGAMMAFTAAAELLKTHTTFDEWVEVTRTLARLLKQTGDSHGARRLLRETVTASQAVHTTNQDELRALLDLSRRLDKEAEQVAAENAQQHFLDKVALQLHGVNEALNGTLTQSLTEIREHLAVLDLILNSLHSGVPTHMDQSAVAKAASEQIAQIVTLLERGARRESRKLTFNEVVEDCVKLYRSATRASGREVVFTPNSRSLAPARVSILRRLVQEVLKHTIRHSPDCRVLSVSTLETDTTLALEVRAEDEDLCFSNTPFLHVDADVAQLSDALGLDFVRKLLELSGGALEQGDANSRVTRAIWSKR